MIFDARGRLLVLKPTYKSGWTIPGGVMEADGETPWDACRREVKEETGISIDAGRLAAVDFRPAKPGRPGGLRFLFDCGQLPDVALERVVLQRTEIEAHALLEPDEALERLTGPLRRRVGAALGSATCVYLEDGRPVHGVAGGRDVGAGLTGERRLDFSGARLDDPDFTGARMHGPNFERARITDAWLCDADVSGYLGGLRLNGVEVAPLIEAELDRRFPERVLLRADDPAGLAEAWDVIETQWAARVARAASLDPAQLAERVDGEWSFLETLRHLVMATDSWLSYLVMGDPRPYHPWGLAGSFLEDPASLGLDPSAAPTLDELLAVRRERMDAVAAAIAGVTPDELDRVCTPPAAVGHPRGSHTVRACLHVILDEEWWHGQYADRDLAVLEGSSSGRG